MIDFLQLISIIISIAGSVVGAVIYINKYQNDRLERAIKQALSPVTYQIQSLNTFLSDNKADHHEIHTELDTLDKSVNDHEVRITVLEQIKERSKQNGQYSS